MAFIPLLLGAQTAEPLPYAHPDEPVAVLREPIPYVSVREADIMWQRRIWRMIDLREKMNQYLYYPFGMNKGCRNLFSIIESGLRNGQLQAYDPGFDDFRVRIDNARALAIGRDTLYYTDHEAEPPYAEIQKKRIEEPDPASVKKFRVKEDWIFDKNRSVLEVRIIGICPVREVRDPITGSLRGEQDMYWIYFPELRRLLANVQIYNPFNMAGNITYDDAFRQRLFSGYIYKEDNVYNRNIDDYVKGGIEALLEAEEIKEHIRLCEAGLWEP